MAGWKNRLRFLAAFGAPLVFSLAGGHFRSALLGRAMDRRGRPLPWYSYPAIACLSGMDFSQADVLEFGAGQSTFWWARRARSLLTFVANPVWCARLKPAIAANVEMHLAASPSEAARLISDRCFDVIVVDDGTGIGPKGRAENVAFAMTHLKTGGLLVIDNSDIPQVQDIMRSAAAQGWSRVDLYGHAPGSLWVCCTSLLFRDATPFLRMTQPPRSRGHYLAE